MPIRSAPQRAKSFMPTPFKSLEDAIKAQEETRHALAPACSSLPMVGRMPNEELRKKSLIGGTAELERRES